MGLCGEKESVTVKQPVTWTVTEASGEVKKVSGLAPLQYRDQVEVTNKMPDGQIAFAKGWNEMRERLILLGEMKSK